jgi:hypothetical protein
MVRSSTVDTQVQAHSHGVVAQIAFESKIEAKLKAVHHVVILSA